MTGETIFLSEEEVKKIAYEIHKTYIVEQQTVDYDSMYKDYAPCYVIFSRLSDGKTFELVYDQYQSHYGYGEDNFSDQTAHEVTKEIVTIQKEVWNRV